MARKTDRIGNRRVVLNKFAKLFNRNLMLLQSEIKFHSMAYVHVYKACLKKLSGCDIKLQKKRQIDTMITVHLPLSKLWV